MGGKPAGGLPLPPGEFAYRMPEQAIDVYLYGRKTSGYLEDDTFFSTYCLVNKVVREIWE